MDIAQKPSKKPKINYALAATLLASGLTLHETAKRTGAANAISLRVGLARKGVTLSGIRNAEGNQDRLQAVAVKLTSQASDALREQMSQTLAKHAEALSKVPVKRDLKHLRSVSAAFEPLARIGKIVHDWGSSTTVGLVTVGFSRQADTAEQPAPAIEVQATPQETPPALCDEPSNPA